MERKTVVRGCVGCLAVLGGMAGVGALAVGGGLIAFNNAMERPVDDISMDYEGTFRDGSWGYSDRLSGEGCLVMQEMLRQHSSPSYNPLSIAYQQLWYNAMMSGYDFAVWLEPDADAGRSNGRQYAIYQSGTTFVLRVEYDGVAQVRVWDLSPEEVEARLEPFVSSQDR